MPGMIDCHVHLLSSAAPDYASRSLKEFLPYTAIRGVVHAHRMLESGCTTVRDVGAPGYGNIALRQAIEDGLVPGRGSMPWHVRAVSPQDGAFWIRWRR
jgi:imidazolonepropionase-like amidohydrolase